MRRLLFAAALALAPLAAANGQDRMPIREFDLPTTEALGAAILRQDAAAWVATDALRAKTPDLAGSGLVGWIVVDGGASQKVRFLRQRDGRLEAAYDIEVTADLKATVTEPSERALPAHELAMFTARQTAIAGMAGQPVCRAGYNTAVVKDPEQPGWLVWLLAPTPEVGAIPFGGHYRFTVSADGRTVTRRDALSASCAVMPKPDPSKDDVAAAFITHIVSPTPIETHVFLQLQSRRPLLIGAGEHMWSIVDGRIKDHGLLKDLAAQSKKK